jgi:hypothetical protein
MLVQKALNVVDDSGEADQDAAATRPRAARLEFVPRVDWQLPKRTTPPDLLRQTPELLLLLLEHRLIDLVGLKLLQMSRDTEPFPLGNIMSAVAVLT